ncbi:hypothetical protein [Acinetobacter baumannii]|uniref:hypothetical protein n=1 Tax=Acinetobacter baumannii TaxID=470 RepID=UPI001D17BCFD|nr:hypothetical protein [Acinetobacter baumannii]
MDKKALLEQFKAEVEASGTSLTHILKMCEFDEVSNDFRSDTIHDYSIGCLNGAWWMFQRQQAKVEELQTLYTQQGINMLKLQKRVDALEKTEFKLAQVKAILQNNPKLLESILVKKIEQALKGEG